MRDLLSSSGLDAFDVNWASPTKHVLAKVESYSHKSFTQCEGVSLAWRVWESKCNTNKPLVLLHGGWGSWTHWIRVIPRLARFRSLFVLDLPGMGDSSDTLANSIADFSNIVAQGVNDILPDAMNYDLAAFSFGAVVGAFVAAQHRLRCRSFTAVGAAGFGDLHHIIDGIKIPPTSLSSERKDIIHKNNLRLLMLSEYSSIDDLAVYIHRLNIERGRFRSRRISAGSGLINALPNINAKIGGIWGEMDKTGGGKTNIEKRRKIMETSHPNCPFNIIKKSGHWIMYERPVEFVSVLEQHLKMHAKSID